MMVPHLAQVEIHEIEQRIGVVGDEELLVDQFAVCIEFEEHATIVCSAIVVAEGCRRRHDDIPVRVKYRFAIAIGSDSIAFTEVSFLEQVQVFVKDEYQKAVAVSLQEIPRHKEMMVGHFDDAGAFAVGIRFLIMEFTMGAVGIDAHEKQLRLCVIGAFGAGKESDALLVQKAIIEVDMAIWEAFSVVDGPVLSGHLAT